MSQEPPWPETSLRSPDNDDNDIDDDNDNDDNDIDLTIHKT